MSDLTAEEQKNVRAALRFLRTRLGGPNDLGKALHFAPNTIRSAVRLNGRVSPLMAFRISRFVGLSLEDVLTGKYPPAGTCPHCGHQEIAE